MSDQSLYAIIVTATSREADGDSVGIEQAQTMALLCGCTVSAIVGCDWTEDRAFIVGPSANANSLDYHQAFMTELERLADQGRCAVKYVEIRFPSHLEAITIERSSAARFRRTPEGRALTIAERHQRQVGRRHRG